MRAQAWRSRTALSVKTDEKGRIFSDIRQKWLVETPEERVRQNYAVTLHNEYGFDLAQMDEELDVTGRAAAWARVGVVLWRTSHDKADKRPPLIVVSANQITSPQAMESQRVFGRDQTD